MIFTNRFVNCYQTVTKYLVTLAEYLIETISSMLSTYHLGLIAVIILFFQCGEIYNHAYEWDNQIGIQRIQKVSICIFVHSIFCYISTHMYNEIINKSLYRNSNHLT